MTIQEQYNIGEEYLFTLISPNGMVQEVGAIAEYGTTEDHIAYIKVEFSSTTRKFVTDTGKPVCSDFTDSGQTLGLDSQTASVPA